MTILLASVCSIGGFLTGVLVMLWAHGEPGEARRQRQRLVQGWAVMAFGYDQATNLKQRALRLLEEALELAQACNVHYGKAVALTDYVWARPRGEVAQEIGGVSVCILALAEAAGLSADECEEREINRVLAKPIEHFRQRNQQKNDAGFLATEG